jgi:hypothetical protein
MPTAALLRSLIDTCVLGIWLLRYAKDGEVPDSVAHVRTSEIASKALTIVDLQSPDWVKRPAHLPQRQHASGSNPLCQNCVRTPLIGAFWRSVLSERQIPQVIVFSRKSSEKGERIDRAFVRPRQVRYQAALRPDINRSIDSKPLLQSCDSNNFAKTLVAASW